MFLTRIPIRPIPLKQSLPTAGGWAPAARRGEPPFHKRTMCWRLEPRAAPDGHVDSNLLRGAPHRHLHRVCAVLVRSLHVVLHHGAQAAEHADVAPQLNELLFPNNTDRVRILRWRSLTRPFREARRFPSTRLYPVLRATRTPRKSGICPSNKDHFLSPRAEPECFDSQLLHRCTYPHVVMGLL
jgi:hypothetical protein